MKYFDEDGTTIYNGDCLEVLKGIQDKTVNSIVTDPPYGLSFMGKKWDYEVPSIDIWKECLRVLKPGGYLLSFAGTRTQHRMACNIEDAGFEIRDMIAWVYGSGFPKSLNIGKAIDKKPDAHRIKEWKVWLSKQIGLSGKTKSQINEECGFTACSYTKIDNKDYWSSNFPKGGKWDKMKSVIGITTEEYDWVADDNTEERGYISPTGGLSGGSGNTVGRFMGKQLSENSVDQRAKEWEGWGTALKPALEPITVARKPLSEKTVAENVLKWGCGGINIDGCRVKTNDFIGRDSTEYEKQSEGWGLNSINKQSNSLGRFPANFIHDGSDEVVSLFPNTKSGALKPYKENHTNASSYHFEREKTFTQEANSGSAARFFYCAKASKAERDRGCEELGEKIGGGMKGTENKTLLTGSGNIRNNLMKNNHPTVKPIALMQYLIKLVTHENGIVLDPFMGSGTTLIAAKKLGINAIGIEINPEYCKIAKERMPQKELF